MTLTRREKFLIVFGLALILIVVYVFYFYIPYQQNTSDANAKYAAAKSQVGILNAKAAGIKTLKSEIASIEEEMAKRSATIPGGIDDARVLLYLEKLAKGKASGLKVSVTGDPAYMNRFLTQPVTVEFNATWPNLQLLLADLKANELYNRVTYLDVTYNPGELLPPAPDETASAEDRQAESRATNGSDVIAVHMELLFFAIPPEQGKAQEPPIPPNAADRANPLFPLK